MQISVTHNKRGGRMSEMSTERTEKKPFPPLNEAFSSTASNEQHGIEDYL